MQSRRPELCVGAVAINEESILLIKRANPPEKGTWSIPGGHIESGESIISAVIREFKEETSLDSTCGNFIGWTEILKEDFHSVILDFEVFIESPLDIRAGSDADEVKWIPLKNVLTLNLAEGLADFLVEKGYVDEITIHEA